MDGIMLLRCICDETRFSILERLSGGRMSVGEIAGAVGRDQPLVSHHLKVLKDCGIVSDRPAGRRRPVRHIKPAPGKAHRADSGGRR